MDLPALIDAFIEVYPPGDERTRLRAAIRLGARIALEQFLLDNSYNTEARKILKSLDGPEPPTSPAPIVQPAIQKAAPRPYGEESA